MDSLKWGEVPGNSLTSLSLLELVNKMIIFGQRNYTEATYIPVSKDRLNSYMLHILQPVVHCSPNRYLSLH